MTEAQQQKRRRLSACTDTSILVIPEILLATISECLSLHDYSCLVSTCRQLRATEQSNPYVVTSIDARVRHLIECVRLWLDDATKREDVDDDILYNDKNNPFCIAMRELNCAGRCGLSGLVELSSVVNVEPVYPLEKASYPDFKLEPHIRKQLRKKCALRLNGTIKSLQWRLCDAEKSKLAKQNARILKNAGTHCLDLKIVRHRITDCNDGIVYACCREREAIYAFSILGRATLPYLKIILGKLIPPLFDEENLGEYGDELKDLLSRWEYERLIESFTASIDVALLVLGKLLPFLTHLEMRIVLDFLGEHINNPQARFDEERRRIAAVRALTELGNLIHGTSIIEKVMNTVKGDLPGYDHSVCYVHTICGFIAEFELTQYLHLPLEWIEYHDLSISHPAVSALESLEPKLSKSQRDHMIQQLHKIRIDDRGYSDTEGVCRVLESIGEL